VGEKRKFSNPMIDARIADRVRNTVRGMRTRINPTYTQRQFVEEAFREWCRRLEEQYNGGRPWPHVDEPLDPGRPSH
jgi:hypothetical protein